ncbi:APC family permease [Parachlamydia sp. AcF125]|uniref:APC family permease n=1 Tax=Parachlamydia sp. AcF125 TaxID=2795736 RepID=UPI001BC97136|nr:APC family permease [Parachlamydia sp. AcF125]MBS4168358.1 putative transporter [Parachlamydia sp. AcF125]
MNLPNQKKLGLLSIILLGINSMVGASIFILPGKAMALVNTWSPFLYLLATLFIILIALCFAKCASLFNKNGAAYLYAREAFGDFVGFEVGMMKWAISIIAWATLAVGFTTALSSLVPALAGEPFRSLLIMAQILFFTVLNLRGIHSFKFLNDVMTITKLIPLLAVVAIGLFFLKSEHFVLLPFREIEPTHFKEAFLMVFYAFTGFEGLAVAAQEMKNPQKNIPIALIIVISFCSLLYFIIQIVAIGVLGSQLAESVFPISDLAYALGGQWSKNIVDIGTLISIGGVNLVASFMTPRTAVALAEDQLIPSYIAAKNRYESPYIATLMTAGFVSLIALSGNFYQLAILNVAARFTQYIPTCLALLVLRRREEWKPLLNGPLYTILPIAALALNFWLLLQISWVQLGAGFGVLLMGVPLYRFFKEKEPSLSFPKLIR